MTSCRCGLAIEIPSLFHGTEPFMGVLCTVCEWKLLGMRESF
jgi:hypothetical protein